MDPIWILLCGMIVVLGGILLFRLHAFLALILGAFVVGGLTPQSSIEQSLLTKKQLDREKAKEPFTETDIRDAKKAAKKTLGERVATGFGNTCLNIGILIAMASIIGQCLLASGSADRIVRSLLKLLGEARAAFSFTISSFILGIPVFFDTVFYLMIPLGKALRIRTGKNYLLYILAITAGGTMAHSLVPPTPGPLFVAGALNVDLGVMILAGCVVCIFTSLVGYAFAVWSNRRMEIPLRDVPDTPTDRSKEDEAEQEKKLPPLWVALLPVVLPVILIAGSTILNATLGKMENPSDGVKSLLSWMKTLGNKNIALTIAAGIGLLTLVRQKKTTRDELHVPPMVGP